MKTYDVKFEFFGKNMQTNVEALTEIHAKNIVKERLNFISVEKVGDTKNTRFSETVDFSSIFGDLFKKKP